MKPLYHPSPDQIALAGVLYALGDPVRLGIVQLLSTGGEHPCSAFDCDLAKSTISHHFKILRESGVIRTRKSGTQHLNSLRREELDRLFPGVLESVLNNCGVATQAKAS
ncbi:MAG: metalloregulator ArsR/SmtB family transcription factor [Cyanobacteria bacterium J06639_1]